MKRPASGCLNPPSWLGVRLAAAATRPMRSNVSGRAISIYITRQSECLKVAFAQAHEMSSAAINPPFARVIYAPIVILDSFSKLQ